MLSKKSIVLVILKKVKTKIKKIKLKGRESLKYLAKYPFLCLLIVKIILKQRDKRLRLLLKIKINKLLLIQLSKIQM